MATSRAHRRTGSAVFEFIDQIGWVPHSLVQIGVGVKPTEALVFKELWPDSSIYGFEPNPETCKGLRESKYPGVLYNLAVSEKDIADPQDLYYSKSWKNGSSLFKPNENCLKVGIGVVKLDSVFKTYPPVGRQTLLWLDCEGSELNVLKGAERFIKEDVYAINVEMTGKPRQQGWARPEEIHSFLLQRGFFQSYVHTIRTVVAQFDSVYLRGEIFSPELCTCMDSLQKWKEWQRNH